MTTQERLITAADYWRIAAQTENANQYLELLRGVLYNVNPPSPLHVIISARVLSFLFQYVEARRLGYVTGETGGFELSDDTVLIPDVAFISRERLPALPDRFTLAPDLAVEVVSPSNRPREVLNKVEAYLEHGTRGVWVIYPVEKVVDVYRLAEDGSLNSRKIDLDGVIEDEQVLPAFRLAVRDIFPE